MVLIGASIIKYNVFFMFAKILLFFPFVSKEEIKNVGDVKIGII